MPFVLIFFLLLLTSNLIPPLHDALASVKTSVTIYAGKGGAPYSFVWIATPGVMILLAALIGGRIQGATIPDMAAVMKHTVSGLSKTILTILAILATAKVMSYSGMISAIASTAASAAGGAYPAAAPLAPLIGALGAFVTGSGTSAGVLFGKLQAEAAAAVGADPFRLAAASTVGAGIGKIISPQCIAIAVAATGLNGQEGKLLSNTLKWALPMLLTAGAVSALAGAGFL